MTTSSRRDLTQLENDVQMLTSRSSEAVSECGTRRKLASDKKKLAIDLKNKEWDARRETACDFLSQRTPRPEKGHAVGRLINNEHCSIGAGGFRTSNGTMIGKYQAREPEELASSKQHLRKYLSGPSGDCFSHYQDQANRLNVDLRAPNHDADLAFNSLKIAASRE